MSGDSNSYYSDSFNYSKNYYKAEKEYDTLGLRKSEAEAFRSIIRKMLEEELGSYFNSNYFKEQFKDIFEEQARKVLFKSLNDIIQKMGAGYDTVDATLYSYDPQERVDLEEMAKNIGARFSRSFDFDQAVRVVINNKEIEDQMLKNAQEETKKQEMQQSIESSDKKYGFIDLT